MADFRAVAVPPGDFSTPQDPTHIRGKQRCSGEESAIAVARAGLIAAASARRYRLYLRPKGDTTMAADLFISYARKDDARVQPWVQQLQAAGVSTWMDVGGLDGA